VTNGGIAGNTTVTVSGTTPNQTWGVSAAGFNVGINVVGTSLAEFHHLRVSGCRTVGIQTVSTVGAQTVGGPVNIRDVIATQNGGNGMTLGNILTAGSVVDCLAYQNGGGGITNRAGVIRGCAGMQNATFGLAATEGSIVSSSAAYNGTDGIAATDGMISNCASSFNNGNGFSGNGTIFTDCKAIQNGSNGITGDRVTIERCAASGNIGDGIRVTSRSIVHNNSSTNSGSNAGVHVTGNGNRIEGNLAATNSTGFLADAGGNLFIKNDASNNGTSNAGNYNIAVDNRYGPIIDDTATGAAAATGKGPFASTLNTTDPWANFSH